MYFVYILECGDRTLYTGITTDVERRFEEHKAGNGGSYTRSRKAKKMRYTEEAQSRSAALKREAAIKKLTRNEKMKLIREYKKKA